MHGLGRGVDDRFDCGGPVDEGQHEPLAVIDGGGEELLGAARAYGDAVKRSEPGELISRPRSRAEEAAGGLDDSVDDAGELAGHDLSVHVGGTGPFARRASRGGDGGVFVWAPMDLLAFGCCAPHAARGGSSCRRDRRLLASVRVSDAPHADRCFSFTTLQFVWPCHKHGPRSSGFISPRPSTECAAQKHVVPREI